LHPQTPYNIFDQQLTHGKEAALALFDEHMHHLGDNAYAAKARKELTEKLIAQDAQHRSRYRVDWVRFPVPTTSRRLLLVGCLIRLECPLSFLRRSSSCMYSAHRLTFDGMSVIWDFIKVAAAFVITVCPALYGLWRWKQSVLRADGDGHHAIVVQAAQWLDGLERSIIVSLLPSIVRLDSAGPRCVVL
jgi:hypothetical protein